MRAAQEMQAFVKERDALERDRLQLRADNDALQHRLEEWGREGEHKHLQEVLALKAQFEEKHAAMAKQCALAKSWKAAAI